MPSTPVIAVFDIGKTNKKLFVFDEDYQIIHEQSVCLPQIEDEDGDACESLTSLEAFVFDSLQTVFQNKHYQVRAINFSTYGASFVNVDAAGQPVTPLYNYLKVYPENLLQQFYQTYGGEEQFSLQTASPVLGHLNSGLHLYWLKKTKPTVFEKIVYSFHLPQYMSYLLTGKPFSDLTSIGCHTGLWDFRKKAYHDWVMEEGIAQKLAPIGSSKKATEAVVQKAHCLVGVGLHDSSAALIPYLSSFDKPFVLISTGTWCISLNPFNNLPLTAGELEQDCLCYLTYEGKSVKASRLFGGNEHEVQVKRLADYFHKAVDDYKTVHLDLALLNVVLSDPASKSHKKRVSKESLFLQRELSQFGTYEAAYHQLLQDLVEHQVASTNLVLKGTPVKQIYVDGGFSNNVIYMHLLAAAFPEHEVYAATIAQASALGAALAIHESWNKNPLPKNCIELKHHGVVQNV